MANRHGPRPARGRPAATRAGGRTRIRIRLGPLAPALAPLLLAQVQLRLGVDPDALAPIEGLRRVSAALLVIAGERDRHTLGSESERRVLDFLGRAFTNPESPTDR